MRVVFVILQLLRLLSRSMVLSAVAMGLVALSMWQWTHAMREWQDSRDGFRQYTSRPTSDVESAELDAQVQAITDQCSFELKFEAEKRDSEYRDKMLAKCQQRIASYRRVAVTKTGDQVVVRAKIKCLCEPTR